MPPTNAARRRALADAAIALLAGGGVHAVTHRAVDAGAQVPTGTASNYFRTREALLVAVVERVVEAHVAGMEAEERPSPASTGAPVAGRLVDLLTASLLEAATTHRDRYLAIFELRLEALRRPAVARAMDALVTRSEAFTGAHHRDIALAVPPERIPLLMTLYGGALFTLVTAPPGAVTQAAAHALAAGLVTGALLPVATDSGATSEP